MRALLIGVFLLGAIGLTQAGLRTLAADSEFQVVRDLSYKPDAVTDYERKRCKLDLYLPEQHSGFATIVWFHGGSLRSGDKAGEIAVSFATRFASAGIAVASVNYRLSPKVNSPAYVEDAAAAVAFVHRAIGKCGGSDRRIFVSGHSAGGYLTAMVGMDAKFLNMQGLASDSIAGYIPIAGQMITHSTVRLEREIPRDRPIIDQAAPAYHARKDAQPFLCIVGEHDLPARAEENRYFVAAMKAAGHDAISYREFPDRNHGTIANQINQPGDPVAAAIEEFIAEVSSQEE